MSRPTVLGGGDLVRGNTLVAQTMGDSPPAWITIILRDLNFAKVDQFCESRLAKLRTQKKYSCTILAGGKFSGDQSRLKKLKKRGGQNCPPIKKMFRRIFCAREGC